MTAQPNPLEAVERLEALARAATGGPWVSDTTYSKYAVVRLGFGPRFRTGRKKLLSMAKTLTSSAGQQAAKDAAFIAAANPETILALISALRSQAEALEGLLGAVFSDELLAKSDEGVRATVLPTALAEALIKARAALTPELKS